MSGESSVRLAAKAVRHHPRLLWAAVALAACVLPLSDRLLPRDLAIAAHLPAVFAFAVAGLGLTVLTGFAGLLNLGAAAFVAVGAYSYAILTWSGYPFQLGFWLGLLAAVAAGALAGVALAIPTLRLRGDYVAIVTLGAGEIVQDLLRNLDPITLGTQGINPLPRPMLPGLEFAPDRYLPYYYLYLVLLAVAVLAVSNLRRSRLGRAWVALRDDELAARALGIDTPRVKLAAFATCAALCAAGGALLAALYGSSIEPGYYDFQLSVILVCIVIVGGLGSIPGALLGALVMIGFNAIVLAKAADWMNRHGLSGGSVFSQPGNWKFLIFGLALVLMARFRPGGLIPARARPEGGR
jgi:branched-chain amino acid transport system permease protein